MQSFIELKSLEIRISLDIHISKATKGQIFNLIRRIELVDKIELLSLLTKRD